MPRTNLVLFWGKRGENEKRGKFLGGYIGEAVAAVIVTWREAILSYISPHYWQKARTRPHTSSISIIFLILYTCTCTQTHAHTYIQADSVYMRISCGFITSHHCTDSVLGGYHVDSLHIKEVWLAALAFLIIRMDWVPL